MKSKLEKALENISKCYVASEGKDLMSSETYGDDWDTIAKAVEAIKILKKYKLIEPTRHERFDENYLYFSFETKAITYEEYCLFKELGFNCLEIKQNEKERRQSK